MTQTDLYRQITGDLDTHHRTITATLDKAEPTQRRVIALYASGLTDREVGKATHRAHGSCRGILKRAMIAAYNRVHNMPRYYKLGRGPRRKPPASETAVTRIAAPELPDTPHGFREFLTPAEQSRV
jgi:hypothetical protein